MLRLASDADVHGDVIRGLRRRASELDLIRVQDVLPAATHDQVVLEWAGSAGRVLLTNDRNTMVGFARQRLAEGKPFPGLIAMSKEQAIGESIDDVLLIAECVSPDEMTATAIIYLPLS